jgi:hypothetical protein
MNRTIFCTACIACLRDGLLEKVELYALPLHDLSFRNISSMLCTVPVPTPPEAGVLDEPYSAKPAQRSSHTGPPGYIAAYVDWRACTATLLRGIS